MHRTIIAVLCILWTSAGAAGGQEPRRVGADEMEKLFDVDYRVETMAVDAQLIVAAGDRHDAYPQVAVYDRGAGKLLGHLDTQRVIRIWLRPPDGAICTVTTEGLLQTWHRSELHELTSLHLGGGYPAVDPSGRFLVVGQGRFEVMDSYSGNILSSSRPHGDRLTWEPPTFSGRSIICWSDMTLRRVDLAGGPDLWSRTFEPEIEHCLIDRAAGRLLMLHRGREEEATRMLFLDPRTGKTLRELSQEGPTLPPLRHLTSATSCCTPGLWTPPSSTWKPAAW
jgi:hypothetical protein